MLAQVRLENEGLTSKLAEANTALATRNSEIAALSKSTTEQTALINKQAQQLALLAQNIKAMEALKASLEKQIAQLGAATAKTDGEIAKERALTLEAQAAAALMSQQLQDMQRELEKLAATLDASDKLTAEQKAQISDLGRRMNRALAGKVQELQRSRSEFFGRLRDILGTRPGVTIVGDRFVFQSEVLFNSGSADLGLEGQRQLGQLARTLLDVARTIPSDINWILRVDGHTDTAPIATAAVPFQLGTVLRARDFGGALPDWPGCAG